MIGVGPIAMQLSNLNADLSDRTKARVELFEDYLWHNSEVCNDCFTRIREIDETVIRYGKNHEKKRQWEYHERTEDGVQDWSVWDNSRFGQCYCLTCGADTSARDETLSTEQLRDRARSIYDYTDGHTPITIDYQRFWKHIYFLKRRSENEAYDTEILAVAFARAVVDDA